RDCCSGACEGGICGTPRCNRQGESCERNGQCCTDLVCRAANDAQVGGPMTCQAGCAGMGAACNGATCCSGLSCDAGRCVPVCGTGGESGAGPGGCCAGSRCVDQLCAACSDRNFTCTSNSDC